MTSPVQTTMQTQFGGISTSEHDGAATIHTNITTDSEQISDMSSLTGWAVIDADTSNITLRTSGIIGAGSLQFDKSGGTAQIGGICKTLDTVVDATRYSHHAIVEGVVSVTSQAQVDFAFIRLGDDASNYAEFQLVQGSIVNNTWSRLSVAVDKQQVTVVGTGLNLGAIAWACVGVSMSANANTLTAIKWDFIDINSTLQTAT